MGANCQPSTAFSLEVLKYQAYFHLIKFDKKPKRRPSSMPNRLSGLRHLGLQRSSLPAIHFNIDTPEEKAAIKIQAAFKGFFAKKLRRACFPGRDYFEFSVNRKTTFQLHIRNVADCLRSRCIVKNKRQRTYKIKTYVFSIFLILRGCIFSRK